MALFKNSINNLKPEVNTGFGTNSANYGGRYINKNGLPNVKKIGINYLDKTSWFHTLLQLPNWKFLILILLFFITINFIFACIYYFIGSNHLAGIHATNNLEKFGEAYFFSAQTFTTVGYGRINPIGFVASFVASFEALLGLLTFALATGLFYGRFSKPKAFIKFSDNALLTPYQNRLALMMRIAPFKNINLTEVEAKATLGLRIEEDGEVKNKFYPLNLEFSKVNALALSWTIVHPINAESPFYKFNKQDFLTTKGEVMLFIKAFDDMFSNVVVANTSFTMEEIVLGAKFNMMFQKSEDGNHTILDLSELNQFKKIDIDHLYGQV
jgi:inward rectifier potassium channel